MRELQEIMDDVKEWSDKTFGSNLDRRLGMIAHLKKELIELELEIENQIIQIPAYPSYSSGIRNELSDCVMLLLDIASHSRVDADLLLFDMRNKLRINKMRKWGKANPNGSIEHIKD